MREGILEKHVNVFIQQITAIYLRVFALFRLVAEMEEIRFGPPARVQIADPK